MMRQEQFLGKLFEIGSAMVEDAPLDRIVNLVLATMELELGFRRGMLTIHNRKSGEIFIDSSFGLSEKEAARGKYRPGEGITGRVVSTGKPVVVPRVCEEPQFLNRTGARKDADEGNVSFLCVPIRMGREITGTLSADRSPEPGISLDNDLRYLSILAAVLSRHVYLHQLEHEEAEMEEENQRLQNALKEKFRPSNIVGHSKEMQIVFHLIEKIAPTQTTVLILGESGVGKELVAQAIHYASQRADKPFIKFNCAALPESIIESELFGHERGAFTGATSQRRGRFELADGGTIFLDEIGELSPSIQTKLLRVLQEHEFERVGGDKTIRVDIRVIAATNRDLRAEIQVGHFREDLFYRLYVFPITVPPLRERRSDIVPLADHFAGHFSTTSGKPVRRISEPAIELLMAYNWPGNVRELENVIERAVILSEDGVIHGYNLPPSLQTAESSGTASGGSLEESVGRFERELILETLKNSHGNLARTARSLGTTERVLGLRVKHYGINARKYRE
jgi:Nif-specific regulatory protein